VAKAYLAEIPVASNSATAWNPNPDSWVYSLYKSGTKLYIGGTFNYMFATLRYGIAEIDYAVNQNALTSFTGAADPGIYSVAQSGSLILAGSSSLGGTGGVVRNNLGSVNLSDGLPTSWKPTVMLNQANGAGSSVSSLAFNSSGSPTSLFVGGYFLQPGVTFGQVSLATGAAETAPISTSVSYGVNSLLFDNNILYVGGYFGSASGGKPNVGIYDYTLGGVPANWIAPVQGTVYTMSASTSNKVFIGGGINKVGNNNIFNLAAFDTTLNTNNLISAWAPSVSNRIKKIIKVGSTLFIGGNFTKVEGVTRTYAAALDTTNNASPLLPWNPVFDGTVDAMAYDSANQIMYMSGFFANVNSIARNRMAGVYTNLNTGNQTAFNPTFSASQQIVSIAVDGTKLYIGGIFTTVNSVARNRMARFTINGDTTGTLDNFDPNFNAGVYSIYIDNNKVYVGGPFTTMSGGTITRNRFAILDKTVDVVNTGNVINWDPNIPLGPSPTYILAITKNNNNQILFGGSFYTVYGNTRYNLGQVCAY
jgi:hypothetical protein